MLTPRAVLFGTPEKAPRPGGRKGVCNKESHSDPIQGASCLRGGGVCPVVPTLSPSRTSQLAGGKDRDDNQRPEDVSWGAVR